MSSVFLSAYFYRYPIVTAQHYHILYLQIEDFVLLLVYNPSLTTASESRLFGSVVRAMVLYRGDPGSIPSQGMGICSAMLYIC